MADLQDIERVFTALADATRIRIVGLLLGGEVCVCHIHESLRIPQSKASRHLAYLRRTGVVETEKRGLWVYYRLARQSDSVTQALLDAARHCIGHVESTRKDALKLEKKTGCCAPAPGAMAMACCAPPSPRAR